MNSGIPTWADCELAVDERTATALQRFIYEYEPGDSTEREWRERLQALVRETREAAFRAGTQAIARVKESFVVNGGRSERDREQRRRQSLYIRGLDVAMGAVNDALEAEVKRGLR